MIGAAQGPPSSGPEPPDDFFHVGAVDSDEVAQRVGRTPESLREARRVPGLARLEAEGGQRRRGESAISHAATPAVE